MVRPVTAPADDEPEGGADAIDDTIEPGKRLIRLPADKGLSLGDRVANAHHPPDLAHAAPRFPPEGTLPAEAARRSGRPGCRATRARAPRSAPAISCTAG